MLFGKKKESNPPTERGLLTKEIAVGLWSSVDRKGNDRFRFSLDRIDEGGTLRRSFAPEHLLQFPKAIVTLAGAFAETAGIDELLRKELARMANALEKVLIVTETNGPVTESAPVPSGHILG